MGPAGGQVASADKSLRPCGYGSSAWPRFYEEVGQNLFGDYWVDS